MTDSEKDKEIARLRNYVKQLEASRARLMDAAKDLIHDMRRAGR